MKATELLVNQHRELEELFERLERADAHEKSALREEIANHLLAHTAIETEIFYPAAQEVSPELIGKSVEEHLLFEHQLRRVLAAKPTDRTFRAKAAVLEDLVNMHVREEEAEVLKRVESALGAEEMQQLGERMQVRFDEALHQGYRKILRKSLAEATRKTARRGAAKKTVRRAAVKKTARRALAKKAARGRGAAATQQPRGRRAQTQQRSSTTKRGRAARKSAGKARAQTAR